MTPFWLDYCRLTAESPAQDRLGTSRVQWSFVAAMLKLSRAGAVDSRILEIP
jgi:hypothetical protein